ncbi:Metallo-hydrolase/oxidoreductase [Dichomitus squalens]|uniref:Metallo-hydrolase/oxidoreductase n=1 Tax=Dichomitus squalens TaxID=114155 RepID=A0A4Q9Q9L6_9APHY|nr:Metallo-hydrolase/oxidoreductase [Dichomitus squalens]TBU64239.1 Metallo-hydrolase/oxidoreductase [Dichomitus squalens]
MMSLPPPVANQAFCDVSALEAGYVKAPLAWILADVGDDESITVPALSFLVRHHSNSDIILLDLGLRKGWRELPPGFVSYITDKLHFEPSVQQDVADSLAQGSTKPSDIKRVFISHLHFDHYGDAALFPTSRFFVGAGGRALVANAYPKNPNSGLPADVVPEDRTTYLDPEEWPPIGPFPHALDFYGDGSLYVVDAGHGHVPGHINLLVRTSADGGWVYLAGDSAHHWSLLTGKGKIGHHAHFGCAHANAEEAEKHIERIKALIEENPRVRVLLAHDEPWFNANKGGPAFWPGKIETL